DWVQLFGSMTQPYEEEYRPEPFSRRFVVHLPGWYAQKHPDEDWAETFAVWLAPGADWRTAYAAWSQALAKLEYCDRAMQEWRDREPLVTATHLEWEVGNLTDSLAEHYRSWAFPEEPAPPGLDGALKTIFEFSGEPEGGGPRAARLPA